MNSKKTIPIFPLDLVLFPRQELPLRIFEPRYKQLVDDCMVDEKQFGVCLVDEKNTIMGWQAPVSIGTIAKIRKCEDIDIVGTQLYVETIGHSRFRINKIIPPSIPLPYDYDPFSTKRLQRITQLYEKAGTEKKLYIRAEIDYMPEITDNITQNQWEKLVEMWKHKIMIQSLPKIINPFQLDRILLQYGLVSETPTIDYIYSLSALGASEPNDLQSILEANSIGELLQKVEELLKRK